MYTVFIHTIGGGCYAVEYDLASENLALAFAKLAMYADNTRSVSVYLRDEKIFGDSKQN